MKFVNKSILILSSILLITVICIMSILCQMYVNRLQEHHGYDIVFRIYENSIPVSREKVSDYLSKADEVLFVPEGSNIAYYLKTSLPEQSIIIRENTPYQNMADRQIIHVNEMDYAVLYTECFFPAGTDLIITEYTSDQVYGEYYVRGMDEITALEDQFSGSISINEENSGVLSFLSDVITRKEGLAIILSLIISIASTAACFYLQFLKSKNEIRIRIMSGSKDRAIISIFLRQIIQSEPIAVVLGIIAAMELQYAGYVNFWVIAGSMMIHLLVLVFAILSAWLVFRWQTWRAVI